MATYQDSKGKVFKSRQDAADSNTSMGTNPRASTYSGPTTNTKPSPQLVTLSKTLAGLHGGGGSNRTSLKQLSTTLANLPGGGARRSSTPSVTPARSTTPSTSTGAAQGLSTDTGGVSTRQPTREQTLAEMMQRAKGLMDEATKLRAKEQNSASGVVASDTPMVMTKQKVHATMASQKFCAMLEVNWK